MFLHLKTGGLVFYHCSSVHPFIRLSVHLSVCLSMSFAKVRVKYWGHTFPTRAVLGGIFSVSQTQLVYSRIYHKRKILTGQNRKHMQMKNQMLLKGKFLSVK